MRGRSLRILSIAIAAFAVSAAGAAAGQPKRAGPQGDGTVVTPVGHRVTPAGGQTELGLLPLGAARSPDGRFLLVSNGGQGTQSLQVVDTRSTRVVQTLRYDRPEALYAGVTFSPDGRRAYASAGGNNKIRVYDVRNGRLTEIGPLVLPTTNPAGVRVTPFPAGLAVSADGHRVFVAAQLADAMTAVDVNTGQTSTVAVGHAPYSVTLSRDGSTAYVANQGADTVSVVDVRARSPVVRTTVRVGTHPNKSVLDPSGERLYVANGDSDTISVISTGTQQVARTIDLRPYWGAQVGSNPTTVAVSADGARLYVANAGNNAVAVIRLAIFRVVGMIPTGWYPTAVIATADRLWVTNGKGFGAGPNDGPDHPNPYAAHTDRDQYVGSMMRGTLSSIRIPRSRKELDHYTRRVIANNGFDKGARTPTQLVGNPVPARPGRRTPLQHVIYVVRENRTFDQVLGSLGKGNGDPALNLFGDESAPNTRELARRFVTIDNFYANAEVSAQGWSWTVAANSNLYTEQLWPAYYSGRGAPHESESADPATAPNRDPRNAYIWQRLARARIGFRNYGFYTRTDSSGHTTAVDPILAPHTDPDFRGFDMRCPDSAGTFAPLIPNCGTARVDAWLEEFRRYERNGSLPTVQLVWLPNDHTQGTRPGFPTPRAYMADNDYALGRLVEAVSHSRFWRSTAIFVTEDDAQNGPDHVDAHRTIALVISPYSQTGKVDSTFYSTVSMLRTIELIVGIGPLTQFDAYATPMHRAFAGAGSVRPYHARRPTWSFTEVNTRSSPLAEESAGQNLDKEDQIDEQTFNEAIWRSVRGAHSRMPPPRHSLWGAIPNDQGAEIEK